MQGIVTASIKCLQSRMKYAIRARSMFPMLQDKLMMVPVKVRCFTSVHSIPEQNIRCQNKYTETRRNISALICLLAMTVHLLRATPMIDSPLVAAPQSALVMANMA